MIYLDYAASAPPYEEVCSLTARLMAENYANPSALHAAAAPCRRILRESRQMLASLLGFEPSGIIFTSGGTESNNTAVKSAALASSRRQLLVGAAEHSSVIESALSLRRFGFRVELIASDSCGRILPEALEMLCGADTALVSVQAVNNETGTVQDISALARIAHRCGALFHCDAVQSFGHVPFSYADADLVSISAHKFGGNRGVGALAVRPGTSLPPLLHGGGQEFSLRSGTENLPAIAGMALAAQLSFAQMDAELSRLAALSEVLLMELKRSIPSVILHSAEASRYPGILSLRFPGATAEELVLRLSNRGVCISAGAACAARDPRPSRTLLAMGLSPEEAAETVRLSPGRGTTEEDIIAAARAIAELCTHT